MEEYLKEEEKKLGKMDINHHDSQIIKKSQQAIQKAISYLQK
jgi:hypothetical protein